MVTGEVCKDQLAFPLSGNINGRVVSKCAGSSAIAVMSKAGEDRIGFLSTTAECEKMAPEWRVCGKGDMDAKGESLIATRCCRAGQQVRHFLDA